MRLVRVSRRKRWRGLLATALALVFAANGVAWMQAWSMTHFVAAGERTPRIEALSFPQRVWTLAAGVIIPKPQNSRTPADVGLAYETRRINLGGGESLEAWYIPHPDPKATVLMFPGYAVSKDVLLSTATALHDMGYSLLLVDFRGSGGSTGQDTTLGVREAVDVARATDYAQHEWPNHPIVLYGISMGAAAVLRAVAVEGVRRAALVLVSPFGTMLGATRNRFHAMSLPAFPASELIVLWGSVQHGFNGFTHNPVDYAQSVNRPTLLMHGDHDARVTNDETQTIYNGLAGPKQVVNFLGAGHQGLVDYSPQTWKEQVERFLDGVGQ